MLKAVRYNGTPRGLVNCNEGGCTRCNHGAHEDACLCLHAEENALLEAGRERIDGATLYCNTYAGFAAMMMEIPTS